MRTIRYMLSKKQLIIGILIIITLSIVSLLGSIITSGDTILYFEYSEDGKTVKYAYLADVLPEKLHENEIVSLRTERSYTYLVSKDTENGTETKGTRAFPKPQYAKHNGVWRYVEYDTLPAAEFKEKYLKTNPIARLFYAIVYADTSTLYSGAGDGNVGSNEDTWDAAHATSTGNLASYTSISLGISASSVTVYSITRIFIPIDTSAIPSNAIIESAFLSLKTRTAPSVTDDDGDDFAVVVQTDQTTHTSLITADFNNAGSTEGSNRHDISDMTDETRYTFTLNSTGLSWIKRDGESSQCSATAGYTCLGVREGHDVLDNPIQAGGEFVTISFHSSEQTGTTDDPYLSVTWTEPSVSATRFIRLLGVRLQGIRLR